MHLTRSRPIRRPWGMPCVGGALPQEDSIYLKPSLLIALGGLARLSAHIWVLSIHGIRGSVFDPWWRVSVLWDRRAP
jgi:hypothetical protein